MTKKLLAALLSIILLFSVGCTGKTIINNNYIGSEAVNTDEVSSEASVSEDSVASETITVKPDIDKNETSSSVSSEIVERNSEPVGTIIWGEQSEYYPYFYTHLTDNQKSLYDRMFQAVVSLSTKEIFVADAENYKKSDVSIAYMALSTDYPDIFWLDGKYTILAYKEGDVIREYYVRISYDRSYEQAMLQSLELKEKVDEILKQVKNMGVLETERFFHDYLCNNVEYSLESNDDNYTAYGALIKGKAVCEGYARSMLLLCRSAGINCTLVRGTADDTPHMWNVIEIYGKWYHLDVTWDDPIRENPGDTEPIYTYFNLYYSQIQKTHTPYITLNNETLDQMTDSNYNYYLPICSER